MYITGDRPVVRVRTGTLIETALHGDAAMQFMGPFNFNDDDADTELVRTRKICPGAGASFLRLRTSTSTRDLSLGKKEETLHPVRYGLLCTLCV